MKETICGVKIDAVSVADILMLVDGFMGKEGVAHIVTVNPEYIVESVRNPKFLDIINKADLAVADGVGLIIMSKALGGHLRERITGVDLIEAIIKKRNGTTFFLLGADEASAGGTLNYFKTKYPSNRYVYLAGQDANDNRLAVDSINRSDASVLFVAFGSPKQDEWIDYNKLALKKIKLAIGIGGAFDIISGVKNRAPVVMQKMGIEWLWRLLLEPKRILRVLNAVVIFPLIIILKINKH
ncbi:MAG: acetylglucosaminyldiphospho-UDP acetyl-beta-D-mannosaminyltransferase [Candidatus Portnoybacteria bacterium CG10_big_fil_rev_8_21_14_0_10_36_7]|uniref:Acetylglucosaminyldiphospho-UDP acetyl-beta-D-mannosaminyltransferase n=1 Tax=Candidatus Portnoybacteria bacterium CG10_big_fil_rev_8_21_14_0_10_36_7 TaxID=1974812 RepID=A0A2M8KEM7_9BACT|nr:MAG: acetylglucosaminyldiphospho-UDP acetyl-beta-D-mannosaminyltransferase [Candidatus Portnoybacteria bacterium CG10_big_fil_rev_8_21_14_0_10_36_7]